MPDLELLKSVGTTNERLREIFTCDIPAEFEPEDPDKAAEWRQRKEDWKVRMQLERRIESRLLESIQFSLKNHTIYSAVDLMWDSTPICRETYPLMLFAQGKVDWGKCASILSDLKCGQQYIKKNEQGQPIGIDLPRFYEVAINLPRSVITRRLAAQMNRYQNLWPYYKYEPRGNTPVDKLRGDIMSQIADIQCDQYDYRKHDEQVLRDTFLYAHSIDFPRSSWERDYDWQFAPTAGEFDLNNPQDREKVSIIKREGICWTNPHPSRTFWDNNYPMQSLNSDSGCTYVGFWDIMRYRDVKYNQQFYNRDRVSYSSNVIGIFTTYAQYFTNYYCTINPPALAQIGDPAADNDRQNNIGRYAADWDDTSIIISNYYEKICPADFGIGKYPYPVWVRFVTANERTILYAEFMPSSPAAVCSYNESDKRQINISVAHELMGYQDQLTNLFAHLLLCIKADHIKVLLINTDVMTPEAIKMARAQAQGNRYDGNPLVIEISQEKMGDMGLDVTKAVHIVETKSASIEVIFRAIAQLLSMVERLMAMSPQEQGQPAPREISATETNLIAGTTESVFGFISESFDAFRAAKKRILYESYIACGNQKFRVPAMNKYTEATVQAAGFTVASEMTEGMNIEAGDPAQYTVIGSKFKLVHDYVFSSRDGMERPSNAQTANVLTQMLGFITANPALTNLIPTEGVINVLNEIFRMVGADVKIEMQEGMPPTLGMGQQQIQQIQQVLDQITGTLEQQSQQIQQLFQAAQAAAAPPTTQAA